MASQLKSRIQADLNEARKQRDKERTLVLSTLLSEIKNREIDEIAEATDEMVVQVIGKGIKLRKDASEQMRAAGRPELADVEDSQSKVLSAYLPEGLSEGEVRAIVRDLIAGGADQMGSLMAGLMPKIRGRFDGKEANRIVREELGG